MEKTSLVGFKVQDHKIHINELEGNVINASQIIGQSGGLEGEIISRSFSSFEVFFDYRVYYIPEPVLGYDGPAHSAHYRVEQDMKEIKKTSYGFWGEEQNTKEFIEIKDNFQSWEINENLHQIVTEHADVKVGEIVWAEDPDEEKRRRQQRSSHRGLNIYKQAEDRIRRTNTPFYKLTVNLFGETTEYDSTRNLGYTLVLPDQVWGIQARTLPNGAEAWMQNNNGQSLEIDYNRKINIGNKVHLQKPAGNVGPLIIDLYGDPWMPYLEFLDSLHLGWEHHEEIPDLLDPSPPTGDYIYNFPSSFQRIDKSGWKEVLIRAQVRNDDLAEPELESISETILSREEEELRRKNEEIAKKNQEKQEQYDDELEDWETQYGDDEDE